MSDVSSRQRNTSGIELFHCCGGRTRVPLLGRDSTGLCRSRSRIASRTTVRLTSIISQICISDGSVSAGDNIAAHDADPDPVSDLTVNIAYQAIGV